MTTVSIRQAKAQLSKLVDRAAKGEAFVITRAGAPVVKMSALGTPTVPPRLGFLAGEIALPIDFDRMAEAEIEATFTGRERPLPAQAAVRREQPHRRL